MRILDRYLMKHLLIPTIFCSFTLILLLIMADLFDHLSDLIKNQTSFLILVQYYLHLIPFAFIQTISWAAFLGTIFLLVTFNTNNEILAMKAAGLNISKIILPILYVGFLIGIISFLVNDQLVPRTFKKAQTILSDNIEKQSQPSEPHAASAVQNFTYFGISNKLYYAKSFDAGAGKLQGVIIFFFNDKKTVVKKIFANEGLWEGDAWRLKGVTEYETNSTGKILGEPKAYTDKLYEELSETPKDFSSASSEGALLSYRELKRYIGQMKANGLVAYQERVELHYKLSSPWHSLIMMLLTVPFLTVSRRKKVIAVNILYCLALVFTFYVTGAMAMAMGRAGNLPPFISAWSNNLLFSIGSVFFMDRAND